MEIWLNKLNKKKNIFKELRNMELKLLSEESYLWYDG